LAPLMMIVNSMATSSSTRLKPADGASVVTLPPTSKVPRMSVRRPDAGEVGARARADGRRLRLGRDLDPVGADLAGHRGDPPAEVHAADTLVLARARGHGGVAVVHAGGHGSRREAGGRNPGRDIGRDAAPGH